MSWLRAHKQSDFVAVPYTPLAKSVSVHAWLPSLSGPLLNINFFC